MDKQTELNTLKRRVKVWGHQRVWCLKRAPEICTHTHRQALDQPGQRGDAHSWTSYHPGGNKVELLCLCEIQCNRLLEPCASQVLFAKIMVRSSLCSQNQTQCFPKIKYSVTDFILKFGEKMRRMQRLILGGPSISLSSPIFCLHFKFFIQRTIAESFCG